MITKEYDLNFYPELTKAKLAVRNLNHAVERMSAASS